MLKPIKTEEQYKEYLKRIYALMQNDLKENSKESDELETLSILVKNYEKAHYPMEEEKEDLGLLLLMQQSDRTDVVSSEEVMKALEDSDSLEDFNINNDFDESEWTW